MSYSLLLGEHIRALFLTVLYGGVLFSIVIITFLIMGNLCGKESGDAFAQPGRTLGAAPPAQTSAAVPAAARGNGGGGVGRTLGGAATASSQEDARSKAALAAEVS